MNIEEIRLLAANCELCDLYKGRITPVFDKGNPEADIFICGMVPAHEENLKGLPFVGRAGKLLDILLEDSGLSLDTVYITNLVKCFLAAGKPLEKDWISTCQLYLTAQIEELRPKVIIALGNDAAHALLPGFENVGMSKLRLDTFKFKEYTIIPTYHPSFLLRKGGKIETNVYYKQTLDDFKKAQQH